jgi:hypothetical protein
MIDVHVGTPNELAKVASKPTQSAAVKWARDYLQGMEKQADKFDRAALEHIRSTREQMLQTSPISKGDKRRWSFDYISIRFVIEIRNPA